MTLDFEKLRKKKDQFTQEGNRSSARGVKFWKPEEQTSTIRVLPAWTETGEFAGQFWREVAQHWKVSTDQKGPVLCPKHTPGLTGECPICDYVSELRERKTDLQAQEKVKDIRAKTAYFLNIIDMKNPVYTAKDVAEAKQARPDHEPDFAVGDPKIQVYASTKTIFDALLDTVLQNEKDITNIENGNDIVITKTGSGQKTRYSVSPKMKATEAKGVTADTKLTALDQVGFLMDTDDLVGLLTSGDDSYVGTKALPADTSSSDEANEESASADDLEAEMLSQLADAE